MAVLENDFREIFSIKNSKNNSAVELLPYFNLNDMNPKLPQLKFVISFEISMLHKKIQPEVTLNIFT